jgi:radical SAM superfamily enzyme YgiQ (UPF0313 family)
LSAVITPRWCPKDFFLPQVNAIAIGEAEVMFRELVAAVANRRGLSGVPSIFWRAGDGTFVRNALSEHRVHLGTLPLPRRDLTEAYRHEYFFLFDKPDTSVATSRGCPFRCKFCSVHEFYRGAINQMTPQRVLSEILAVSTDHITFVDDNFLMNCQRENAIADLVKSHGVRRRFSLECRTDSVVRHPELVEKWVDIGLYAVLLGLEGGGDKMLRDVNKSCTVQTNDQAIRILQDHGVIIWGAFHRRSGLDGRRLPAAARLRQPPGDHAHAVHDFDSSAGDTALPGSAGKAPDGRLRLL